MNECVRLPLFRGGSSGSAFTPLLGWLFRVTARTCVCGLCHAAESPHYGPGHHWLVGPAKKGWWRGGVMDQTAYSCTCSLFRCCCCCCSFYPACNPPFRPCRAQILFAFAGGKEDGGMLACCL